MEMREINVSEIDAYRFMASLVIDDGCCIWRGKFNNKGYPLFAMQKQWFLAHRVGYTLFRGAIPEGMDLDHLCREPKCINWWHLEVVTHRENLLRGDTVTARYAARTHCSQGHEFSPENTGHRKDGSRRCRECQRSYNHTQYLRRKALREK